MPLSLDAHVCVCVHGVVTRTNIEIDDELIARAMTRYGLRSKRATVEFALRRLVAEPMSREQALAMEGSGWDADLEDLRASTATELG